MPTRLTNVELTEANRYLMDHGISAPVLECDGQGYVYVNPDASPSDQVKAVPLLADLPVRRVNKPRPEILDDLGDLKSSDLDDLLNEWLVDILQVRPELGKPFNLQVYTWQTNIR